jgi:hypothetical protein
MKTITTEYNYNYCDNSNDDEEVIISKNADADADNVVHAYAKQPSYDARFNAEEEVYAKAYAFALETAQQSPKALAEQSAQAEVEAVEAEAKQAIDAWTDKNQNKCLYPYPYGASYPYGVEPPTATLPVLFIEEFVPPAPWSQYTTTDWRAYIFYDATRECYVLNGTRRRKNESKTFHPDIHMTFASKSSLAFYLRKSMCARRHDLSITMYSISRNVLHIISTPNAIPNFHSIHNCRSKFRSELFGYDNCHPSTRELKSYFKVLRDGTEGIMFK